MNKEQTDVIDLKYVSKFYVKGNTIIANFPDDTRIIMGEYKTPEIAKQYYEGILGCFPYEIMHLPKEVEK